MLNVYNILNNLCFNDYNSCEKRFLVSKGRIVKAHCKRCDTYMKMRKVIPR